MSVFVLASDIFDKKRVMYENNYKNVVRDQIKVSYMVFDNGGRVKYSLEIFPSLKMICHCKA